MLVESFKALAEAENKGYQTLINQALRESLERKTLNEETLRRVIREEIGSYAVTGENRPKGKD